MTFRSRNAVLLLLSLVASQVSVAETSKRYLSIAIGHIAVLDDDVDNPAAYKIEYRFEPRTKWLLAPSIGAARSENSASFVFVDLEKDFFLGDRWVITPNFGLGSFDNGKDVKLGHELEFRSGLKLAYRSKSGWRFGVSLFHLSNGGLGDRNPGTEPAFLSLSIPL